jgi:hypothetical protein
MPYSVRSLLQLKLNYGSTEEEGGAVRRYYIISECDRTGLGGFGWRGNHATSGH